MAPIDNFETLFLKLKLVSLCCDEYVDGLDQVASGCVTVIGA